MREEERERRGRERRGDRGKSGRREVMGVEREERE
jgi:hypothetical protein